MNVCRLAKRPAWLAVTVAIGLTGCLRYETVGDAEIDFEDGFARTTQEIAARSVTAESAVLATGVATLEPKVDAFLQRHFARADELVRARTTALRDALAIPRLGSSIHEKYRLALLNYTLGLDANYVVLESEEISPTAFPSGRVIIPRGLTEAFYSDADEYDETLLGVFIHGLSHVRDGHAVEQWATADARRSWTGDRALGAVSALTALVPFVRLTYDIDYPIRFEASKELPTLSEFAADLRTVWTLERAGYDSRPYVSFLGDRAEGSGRGEGSSLLAQRSRCLSLSTSTFDPSPSGVMVGRLGYLGKDGRSGERDQIAFALNLSESERIYKAALESENARASIPGLAGSPESSANPSRVPCRLTSSSDAPSDTRFPTRPWKRMCS